MSSESHLDPSPGMSAIMSTRQDTPKILTLAPEILSNIISQVPHKDLPALALVCRKFYHGAIPQMYRSVHFVDESWGFLHTYKRARFPDWQSSHIKSLATTGKTPHQDTRIFNLLSFLKTITASRTLRCLVKATSFQWELNLLEQLVLEDIPQPVSDLSPELAAFRQAVLNILDLLGSSLQHLHVSSPVPHNFVLPSTTRITSLEIRWPHWRGWYDPVERFENAQEVGNLIYPSFDIPTLQHLTLCEFALCNRFSLPPTGDMLFTSNVTSISLRRCFLGAYNIAQILLLPKVLKSFDSDFWPTPHPTYSLRDYINSLSPHWSSLEEVVLTSSYRVFGKEDIGTVGSLHKFTKLKRLGLAKQWMCMDIDSSELQEEDTLNKPEEDIPTDSKLYKVLPPGLEELQIGLDHVSEGDRNPSLSLYTKEELHELSRWLCEIAQRKCLHYPSLKRVVLWQKKIDPLAVVPFCPKLDRDPEGFNVVSTFKNAGIDLCWVESLNSPFLSV